LKKPKLGPEERVNTAVHMSDLCVDICAGSIRDHDPMITEEELLKRVRERIGFGKSRHREV
jgi:hypothetical protein